MPLAAPVGIDSFQPGSNRFKTGPFVSEDRFDSKPPSPLEQIGGGRPRVPVKLIPAARAQNPLAVAAPAGTLADVRRGGSSLRGEEWTKAKMKQMSPAILSR